MIASLAKVAIITRTKNRPLLLERALNSVSSQTLKDFVWVIVNDGGDQEPVNQIVASGQNDGLVVKCIHNQESLGMEVTVTVVFKPGQSFWSFMMTMTHGPPIS